MSSHDLNKMIEDALNTHAASDDFKEHLLQNSTAAFAKGRALQRRLRMTGLIFAILLVTGAAFICGRFSVSDPATNRQVALQASGEEDEGIRVSKEMVAWLDAARFFTQLGMDERAALSYKQASDLVPYDALPESYQASFEVQRLCANNLEDQGATVGHSEEIVKQTRSPEILNDRRRALGLTKPILSKITTPHFGRSEP